MRLGRLILILFLAALVAPGANLKLYLKDGEYHLVREYKVTGDRVRFYSIERSDWEEVPLDLVDLKRTETEAKSRQQTLAEESKIIAAEEKVERERADEIAKVPQGPGVHMVNEKQVLTLKQAEAKVRTNKRRSVLAAIAPIPVVAGKGTMELDGETATFRVPFNRPEFYISLAQEERFGMIRLRKGKALRIVEKLTFVPITKEVIEEPEEVEIFRQQVDEGLYKIWPTKPLEPGEYAVVEYTEGKLNMQVWDFAYDPAAKLAPPPPDKPKEDPELKKRTK